MTHVPTETTTRRARLRAWLGLAQVPRRGGARRRSDTPVWVRAFVGAGRPAVTVTVLILCAPGEHHLAVLAGWGDTLAWGMAAVLAAYAGIAAVVAGQRPRGTAGHWTAVLGAAMSLLLAMAAQPISHLFVVGWLSATPRAPIWLVVGVSCVPAFVLAHLLHLAATPVSERETVIPEQRTEVPPGLLSTQEVADLLKITKSAVSSRVHRGTLVPAMKDPDLGNLFSPESIPSRTPAGVAG